MRFSILPVLGILAIPASVDDQGTARTDRVWSLWLEVSTCGMDLTRAYSYIMDNEDPVDRIPLTTKGPMIFQWYRELPKDDKTYGVLDMLVDMSATCYALEIHGIRDDNQPVLVMLFLSPAGVAKEVIPQAPAREDRTTPMWDEEDVDNLTEWIVGYHTLVHSKFLRSFQALAFKRDMRITMPIKLNAPWCLGEAA